jgi:hypothetical protein
MTLHATVIDGWERIHLHFFKERQLQRIRTEWANVSIHRNSPEIVQVPNGMVIGSIHGGEKTQGVYDENNRLVDASLRIKGFQKQIDVANKASRNHAVRDGREAYYMGIVNAQYGHFLLEALSRAWAWDSMDTECVPVMQLFSGNVQSQIPEFVRMFLSLVPGLTERIEWIRLATRFDHVVLPGAAFVFDRKAYTVFKSMCERMAERACALDEPMTDRPLYLSRAGLDATARRFLVGEKRLEQFLEKEGFLIAYPERLSIAEQIALFNKHRWIVSPMGSACHTRIFSRRSTNLTMLARAIFSPNFPLCDQLCEGEAHYINVLSTPNLGLALPLIAAPPLLLDEQQLLAVLRSSGLVRSTTAPEGPVPGVESYKKKWLQVASAQASQQKNADLLQAIDEVAASLKC